MKLKTRLKLLIAEIALAEATWRRQNAEGWERMRRRELAAIRRAVDKAGDSVDKREG